MLKTFFRWAVSEEFIRESPVADLKPPSKSVERERTLSDDEIVAVWSGCDKIGWPYGPLFKLLRLRRRNESGGWSGQVTTKAFGRPRQTGEERQATYVHLSALPSKSSRQCLASTAAISLYDCRRNSGKRMERVEVVARQACSGRRGRRCTICDTAASGMAQLGIAPQVVDKVLNHRRDHQRRRAHLIDTNTATNAKLRWKPGADISVIAAPKPSNVLSIAKSILERS
jgi:hypothetical protein